VTPSVVLDVLSLFSIDNIGQVRLEVAYKINREIASQIRMTIKATDGGTDPAQSSNTADVVFLIGDANEFPPKMTPVGMTASLAERE
jgi:hypothetical protein